jgi:hypothetical protein
MANLFGGGMILGIFGLIIIFIIAYKFQLPPILIMITMGIAGYIMAGSILGDWIKALVLIGFGAAIAIIGYRVMQG